jgi:hypothetical protein
MIVIITGIDNKNFNNIFASLLQKNLNIFVESVGECYTVFSTDSLLEFSNYINKRKK